MAEPTRAHRQAALAIHYLDAREVPAWQKRWARTGELGSNRAGKAQRIAQGIAAAVAKTKPWDGDAWLELIADEIEKLGWQSEKEEADGDYPKRVRDARIEIERLRALVPEQGSFAWALMQMEAGHTVQADVSDDLKIKARFVNGKLSVREWDRDLYKCGRWHGWDTGTVAIHDDEMASVWRVVKRAKGKK